jgi:hypothetical protein
MSDKMRWRYGDTNPVVAAVDADTVIEIGDLVWLDKDDAKPASALWQPEDFANTFLGNAMQRSVKGCTSPIRVATTGVFEFECDPTTFELGNLIGVDDFAGSLKNQQVTPVGRSRYAIGRVAKRQPLPTTTVLVAIKSTIMEGGVE